MSDNYMYGKVFVANNEPEEGNPKDPMYRFTLHFHKEGSFYMDGNGVEKSVGETFDPKTRKWSGKYWFPDEINTGYTISVIFDPTYRQFLQQSKWLPSFIYTGNLKGLETHVGSQWWSGATESDEKMDAERVLNDIDYAANKGECFLRLNKEFSI